jgi:CDP-4-dehydro-6-deoxyglucose reductase
MAHRIRVQPSGHVFASEARESILEAGLRSGLNLRYHCKNGSCGQCAVRVLSGQVQTGCPPDFHLPDAERAAGWVLSCCVRAMGDLEIEAGETSDAADIPEQRLTAKVSKLERVEADTLILHLRTPRSRTLRFLAGQQVQLRLPDGASRSLPLASCPCDGMNLSCHVHHDPTDGFSRHLFARLKNREPLELVGPRGTFTLDEEARRPLLFIAEETGFAPVESLIEHAIALEWEPPISLYWLSGRPGGHYLGNYCRSWVDALDDFHYQAMKLQPAGELDLAAALQRIVAQVPGLQQRGVYAAVSDRHGPEVRRRLLQAGLPASQLHLETLEHL